MATVTSRAVVDTLIAGDGHYPGDPLPVLRIVEYYSPDGTPAWSLLYPSSPRIQWTEAEAMPGANVVFRHDPATCERCKTLHFEDFDDDTDGP